MPDAPPLTPSLNLLWILQDLAARGITSVLVEAGAVLNSALLEQNLVQRWIHCTAPKVLGQGALPMLTGIAAAAMPDNWRVSNRFRLGDDSIAVFEKIQLI
jgi:diaminohydroxyphosphoribosylaminopyrimidine deaminase/5-amino-6-(5-phosphoribosylamino)uracil reductase